MKKLIYTLAVAGIIGMSTGCNDGFLEKVDKTGLSESNAFISNANFQSFMWPCYGMFTDMTIATSTLGNGWANGGGQYQGDVNAGYLENKGISSFNQYSYQTVGSATSGNGWSFGYIRRVNLMLSHIDESQMNQEQKDHWRSVGYFFHGFWYMELINRFGDLPWVDKVLNESSPETYGPQLPRDTIANRILMRLKWAEEHIGTTDVDGPNTINQDVVRAAISRFGLREGTWRKYHGLSDADKYLKECVRASKLLIDKYPHLYKGTDGQPAAGYGEMWTTDDLSKVPGIILYKSYVAGLNPVQGGCYVEHTASMEIDMPQQTVDLYLMRNGKPIANSASGYHGDKNMYATFRDRDPRLYHTVMPPYKVEANGSRKPAQNSNATWGYTDNPADREYIDIMGENWSCSNPGVGMKRLPAQNWSASLVPEVPRIQSGFVTSRTGYYVWKMYCNWEKNFNNGAENVADKPIFKIEEVLLNYAEAMYELGHFDQSVADITINKLRDRAEVAAMKVAEIDANFDPNRPKWYPKNNLEGMSVDPVLWEIRRERIIELMGEGFGFYDIRRWRMAPYFLNRAPLGMWASKEYAKSKSMTLYNPATGLSDGANGAMTEGYLYRFNDPSKENKGWLEKYYLYQVPTTELLLNKDNLKQTPGWDTASSN